MDNLTIDIEAIPCYSDIKDYSFSTPTPVKNILHNDIFLLFFEMKNNVFDTVN
jgi:hypothetical protein